jgi:cytochrome b involved in lipid metabolism
MIYQWLMALVLSTLTGIAYIIAGKLFLSLPATHFIGTVILDRFKSTRLNWEQHTGRSTIETSLWLLATAMAWKWSNGSYFFTIPFGTSMGIIVVLLSTVFGWGKPIIWKQPPAPTSSVVAAASTTASTTSASTTTAGAATNQKQTKVRGRRTTTFEWPEVQLHSSRHDCWIVIHGIVYDITKWGPKHPGGSIIYKYGGKDCSDQFEAFHRPHVKTRLSAYKIGVMSKDANAHTVDQTSDVTLAYRNLRDTLWKEGHFNANPTYFYWKHVVWVSFIVASIALVVVHHHGSSSAFSFVTTSLSTGQVSIIAGCALGLGWQQVAFVAHDAAHNGIIPATKGGGLNWLGWFLGSPIFGISSALWTEEHNAHHAVTLRPREDPQFNYLPLWMISEKELSVKVPQGWSGEAGQFPMNGVVRFLISIQHWTFLPLCMLIGRFNFYLISWIYALKLLLSPSSTTLDRCRSVLDLLGMSMYWLWFVSVTSMFQATSHRAIFVLASHWTVGILHVQLLLSHLATTTFTAEEEEEAGFFQFQLGTSRNIDVYAYEHWFHGGLEYQIEHHLFPQLPRHQLAVVQPMVIEICQKHNIQYRSVGFMAALQECLSDFKRLATDIITLEMG